MLTSSRYGVQYPQSTDSPNVPRDITSVVNALETSVMFTQGSLASRPVSTAGTPGKTGRLFAATDQVPPRLFYDFGTGWFDVGALIAQSVITAALADLSVTAAKIATDTITATQIAPDAIGASELAANAVGASELADASVDTGAIIDASITTPKMAPAVPLVPIGAVMDWPWASGSIPTWAVLAYGQQYSQATYPAMQIIADAASRPYGGAAGSTFNVPDYRGRVGPGKDDMGGTSPTWTGGTAAGRITVALSGINGATLGAVGGAETVVLTTAMIPAHAHTATEDSQGNHGHTATEDDQGYHSHSGSTQGRSTGHYHSSNAPASVIIRDIQGGGTYGSVMVGFGGYAANQTTSVDDRDHTHVITGDGSHHHNITVVANGAHTHNITVQPAGGGLLHTNLQPIIVVNKMMRIA